MAKRQARIPGRRPTTGTEQPTTSGGARREPRTPHQSQISVSDVPEYTSREGASKANDEMRRLQDGINRALDEIRELQVPAPVEQEEPTRTSGGGDRVNNVTNVRETHIHEGAKVRMLAGTVWINKLPKPAPPVFPEEERYLYENIAYTPEAGFKGWYVYGLIRHNWGLQDKRNFVLELFDLAYKPLAEHRVHLSVPQHDGLDENTVILRGVYSPAVQRLEFDPTGELLTDLLFHFVLVEKEGAADYSVTKPGWVFRTPGGEFWYLSIDNSGALALNPTTEQDFDSMILRSPDGTSWYVSAADGGTLESATTSFSFPMVVKLTSPDDTVRTLQIDNGGALLSSS